MNLKPDTLRRIDEVIPHYPNKRSASLPLLHLVQEDLGFISDEAIEWIAAKLGLQPINIFELVTFYPMFRRKPIGRRHIKVCRTLSCALMGEALQNLRGVPEGEFGCELGETSADDEATVEFVECLASCGTAPVVMIDEELHQKVDAAGGPRAVPKKSKAKVHRSTAEIHFYTKIAKEREESSIFPQQNFQATPNVTLDSRQPNPRFAFLCDLLLITISYASAPEERRIIFKHIDEAGYTERPRVATLRNGGYQVLKKSRPAEAGRADGRGEEIRPARAWRRGLSLRRQVDAGGCARAASPFTLVVNADESEPGTFKDYYIMEQDPHQLIEGIMITCFREDNVKQAYIYIRGEFPQGARILEKAIAEARAANFCRPGTSSARATAAKSMCTARRRRPQASAAKRPA